MATLLQRIIAQLDALVPYLSLAHTEVFELVAGEYDSWCNGSPHVPFPNNFDAFRTQVNHSAFVLGYSYSDAFLADLMREIYLAHPEMLPRNKRLSFETIIEAGDYTGVVSKMIDHEVYEAMHGSIPDIQKYFSDKFSIAWPSPHASDLATASLIRNCIVHNNSLVDAKLARANGWELNEQIVLTTSEVHQYGIAIRGVVRHLYEDASVRHLQRNVR